jgi:hypothetical protein
MRSQQRFQEIREAMQSCYQFEGVNMIQHGEMVHDWYNDLMTDQKYEWDFGKVDTEVQALKQLARSPEQMRCYQIYHDCGKPFCRTVDENGKQHFPNHAQVSHDVWLSAGGSKDVAWMILHDMDFHMLKGDALKPMLQDPRAPSMLLTAWAELHANAQMFGGTQSTSFKIKRKFLEKNTKDLYNEVKHLFN